MSLEEMQKRCFLKINQNIFIYFSYTCEGIKGKASDILISSTKFYERTTGSYRIYINVGGQKETSLVLMYRAFIGANISSTKKIYDKG